jgi:hypothetical protein
LQDANGPEETGEEQALDGTGSELSSSWHFLRWRVFMEFWPVCAGVRSDREYRRMFLSNPMIWLSFFEIGFVLQEPCFCATGGQLP